MSAAAVAAVVVPPYVLSVLGHYSSAVWQQHFLSFNLKFAAVMTASEAAAVLQAQQR
jgi:hypothetical protein